jgi:hypothetical protein
MDAGANLMPQEKLTVIPSNQRAELSYYDRTEYLALSLDRLEVLNDTCKINDYFR